MIIRERDKKALTKSIKENEDRVQCIRNEIDETCSNTTRSSKAEKGSGD